MSARSGSRIKTKTIQVRATPEEKDLLKARAAAFGISVGELCRQSIIFRTKPKSKTDIHAIQELALARVGLARLGNLLKGWLAGSFPAGLSLELRRIEELLHEIEAAKNVVVDAAKALGKLP